MSEFVKPYNNDPFVGNLSTPVTTSTATKLYLGNLPIYRKGLSPLMRGLEIGMAHGYFLIGPFYILGPMRNTENALLIGFIAALGLIFILTIGLTTYGLASFQENQESDLLESSKGWRQFTSGFFIGAFGGDIVAYLLLSNIAFFN
jgi:photosystem I subunit 11|tara:strand:+ start:73 stop:510 length:438 start_codon:yes stop_codon:yes gene_type:complete